MAERIEFLSTTEYEAVGQALFEFLAAYPDLPHGVKLDYQSLEGINHIGFTTTPGGKYIQRYVTGGFMAQLPFQIMYKFAATNNAQRLEAEKVIDAITRAMENRPYPLLSDGRTIEDITFNSIPYRSQSDDDGSIVYVRNGVANYEKE